MVNLSPMFWRPLGELEESVRTGRPSFESIFGKSFFDWLTEYPAEAEKFAASMNAATAAIVPAILTVFDFSPYRKIVDVGGGQGALLAGMPGGLSGRSGSSPRFAGGDAGHAGFAVTSVRRAL